MNLKFPIIAALWLFLPVFTFAIGPYKPGDQLVCHAQSGLVLRKTAAPDGEKAALVPYGETLTVLKSEGLPKSHEVEEFPGYTIKGYWVKVQTKDKQEGFVFDGYLSFYPVPVPVVDDQQTENAGCTAEIYMLQKSPKKGVRINLAKQPGQYDHYRQLYKNGASVLFQGGEGGSAQIINFEKSITIEEAYLIGKGLWLKDMKLKTKFKKNIISAESEDGLWAIEVANRGGITVLTMSHAD